VRESHSLMQTGLGRKNWGGEFRELKG